MIANLGELDTLRDLAHRLDEAGHGKRKPLVKQVSELLNCSEQTVYRKLKQVGWKSGRKRRKDAGKISVSEDTAKVVAHLMHKATRDNGKRIMHMTDARNIVRDSGFADADVSTTTLSRAMRRYRCHPDMLAQGKAHVHMRTLYPNHCWQVDPSMCVLFYLPKGGLSVMEESKFY
ncbi:transposase, partial [Pseudodesulfovibrio sp. JC047]|uniref:helix-turn-helix domain-containing protein n=1 Tax=Pseudodesulfovibrio sp. JC047 TaxID=2683199 RepID=UPI0013D0F22E